VEGRESLRKKNERGKQEEDRNKQHTERKNTRRRGTHSTEIGIKGAGKRGEEERRRALTSNFLMGLLNMGLRAFFLMGLRYTFLGFECLSPGLRIHLCACVRVCVCVCVCVFVCV
jgi:hypothetical protein